jgi:geranylgeranyl diphosphate synthase type I
VATLRTFGRELGLAFQAVDDLLGIWGDPAVTGKPAASDLRRRKKTLPVLHALRLSSVAAERELTSLLSEGELADRPLARAVELLEAAGSRGWTQRFAERHLERALARLEGCRLKPAAADDLRDVALFITGRDF